MTKGFLFRRLAARLRELRGDESQVQFAKRIGISNASLNRIEAVQQNVSLTTLETMCIRLRCDVKDLFPPDKPSPS